MSVVTLLPVPTTLQERHRLIQAAKTNPQLQRQIIDRCRFEATASVEAKVEAICFFINLLVWTIDPRKQHEGAKPLFLWPVQITKIIQVAEEALAENEPTSRWWEKSRGVGMTWVFLAWSIHGWLFRPNWQGLLGSYEEALVDDRTLFSHFGKIDFLLERLPEWFRREMMPGFHPLRHRQKLKLVNPNSKDASLRGNILQGDSATEKFARGGRFLFVLFDEAGFWPNLAGALGAASMSCQVRFGASTANGMNYWGNWVANPDVRPGLTRIHWSEVPGQGAEWYRKQCAAIVDKVMIARELDISYTSSVEGRVYQTWDACTFGEFPHIDGHTDYVSWDVGLDTTALIWWQRDPVSGDVRMVDCYKNKQKPIKFYAPFVSGTLSPTSPFLGQYTAEDRAKIAAHSGWGKAIDFADPSVTQRDVGTGKSPADYLAEEGIHLRTNAKLNTFAVRYSHTVAGLAGLLVNKPALPGPVGCWGVNEAMLNAHYPQHVNAGNRVATTELPVHDSTSHFRTAVEYFFVNLPPRVVAKRPEPTFTLRRYDRRRR